jgi:hypothetical protein
VNDGPAIDALARSLAPALADRVVWRQGRFRSRNARGLGTPMSTALVVTAVGDVLPSDLDPNRREHLARAIAGSPAFVDALRDRKPSLSGSLDDSARLVLSRLDVRRATGEQVRDALAAAGIHIPLVMAETWLTERRAS